ncbi:potassium-transporting ATPase subunit KdpA [Anabaena sp. FACHB-709]|uniref:Potassium-transporting ATPase potassium-binding subunit n=3 Tax=Nostocaceae TaxID=1162 RepID=KDPA_NOSS1|nr:MULTISPECIES: potassium-transporting ATPase subunit KdpA [Nostocaceae]Q8YPE8.1 RecName: Full=Potassium-transporting ATPase potassium-binding subunit; AltName: Full=ATP phosphohydrolase [potassium-transporting] A chain; AltName: Full=Potassium-binding and translocating subunit A; AltName: Full=Potassium-translocating ATPase A chain [Nostoc sp. PCC 7120 = FACHB-418]BAY69867.1 potassium-dependent ATPase subunit A [Trichormus variabilis NIES-23]HBW33189.1 potassium-transporting ATPase subunit A [
MGQGLLQIGLTLCIVIAITPVLGRYIARVFLGERTILDRVMNPIERSVYVISGVRPKDEMTGWQYIRAILYTNLFMGILVYSLIYFQRLLPWNPNGLGVPSWDIVLHTVISFVTNTDQQHYAGETTLSYFSQVAALGFLMFTSAATGLAVGIAFIRGLTGRKLGNFYVDLTRGITRILLPISVIGAIALVLLGVPQTIGETLTITTLEGGTQYIARGPVASFEMIKMLGENGGGFFAANSAHPFENPNGLTNLIETIAMIAIPAAMIYTYGVFAKNIKQAWLLFWMVFIVFVILVWVAAGGELQGNPLVNGTLGIEQPNLEGKEVRFGWAETALWAVMTTATMCGAVNGMHDSLMPQGLFATLFNLFLQIIWGGQGTGTAYLFIYLILTVFLTGLMVGRTPEIFGRKIEKREIVLASLILLIHPIVVLIPSAIALAYPFSLSGISNPSFHGISQVVYEYASASANNGSGLEGLTDNSLWWNLSTSLSILTGRYVPIIAMLLLADSMSRKQTVPQTPGTLKTDSLIFTTVTAGIVLILGVLTFFPVLALGPIAEGFKLASGS